MTLGFIVELIRASVMQILMISAPVLLIGMTVGLIIAIFQATTSIQEQTLTFVPKIAAILITIAVLGGWMFTSLREFALLIIRKIPDMAG